MKIERLLTRLLDCLVRHPPPGVVIRPMSLIGKPWHWFYVGGLSPYNPNTCWRVRSPLVLLALAIGWRPSKVEIPVARLLSSRKGLLVEKSV